jgi:hypothetical protein
MRHALVLAISLAAPLIAAPAGAKDDPCAKYEAPLEYNACLARHGPPAGATRAIAPDDDFGAPRADARKGRERMRMEFDVGGKRRP